jgi:hypothetical protein
VVAFLLVSAWAREAWAEFTVGIFAAAKIGPLYPQYSKKSSANASKVFCCPPPLCASAIFLKVHDGHFSFAYCKSVPSSGWVLASSGDDDGGGYFVLGFEVEQLDAPGAAAGGADGLGVDADDLAELAGVTDSRLSLIVGG